MCHDLMLYVDNYIYYFFGSITGHYSCESKSYARIVTLSVTLFCCHAVVPAINT